MNTQIKTNAKPNETGKTIKVDFLFLDESVCVPCGSTADSLDEAMKIVSPALQTMGISLELEKTHISTPEKAISERLLSSPTIRVNDTDIDPSVTEDDCPTCSDIAKVNVPKTKVSSDVAFDAPDGNGCCESCEDVETTSSGPSILCRTWHWQDQIFQAAPVGKIVESLMLAAVSSKASANSCCATLEESSDYEFPENLKTFFSVKNQKKAHAVELMHK